MAEIRFRCRRRSFDGFVAITVDRETGIVTCECGGAAEPMCEHIDATLLSGEEAMIHEEDRSEAREASLATRFSQFGPPVWKRDWQRDHRWRGLQLPEKPGGLAALRFKHGGDYESRPKVCFTGNGDKPREVYIAEARLRGWRAVDSFQPGIKVMVAVDPAGESSKLQQARAAGIPIVGYIQWEEISVDGEWR